MISLPRMLFSISIFMVFFISTSPGELNETTTFSKIDTLSQKSTALANQSNFEKCFRFGSLKHGIYARISVQGSLVKGIYVLDYDYSGDNCKEYPFDGVIKNDIIDIIFKQKNPYEMSLGWELEGGEENLNARLKIINDRLVHARAFSSYEKEIKQGIESIDFMKEINCNEIPCY